MSYISQSQVEISKILIANMGIVAADSEALGFRALDSNRTRSNIKNKGLRCRKN